MHVVGNSDCRTSEPMTTYRVAYSTHVDVFKGPLSLQKSALDEMCGDEEGAQYLTWCLLCLCTLNGLRENLFRNKSLEEAIGAMKVMILQNWGADGPGAIRLAVLDRFHKHLELDTPFIQNFMLDGSRARLIQVTTARPFIPRSAEESQARRLEKHGAITHYRNIVQASMRTGALLENSDSQEQFLRTRKLLNGRSVGWSHPISPPRVGSLQRAKKEKHAMFTSEQIVDRQTGQLLDVVGNSQRVSITEIRRSWNKRVGTEDMDKMLIVRVGIPAPRCHQFGTLFEWIELFTMVSGCAPLKWNGQQVLDSTGNRVNEDPDIDPEKCLALEFRLQFKDMNQMGFSGAKLRVASAEMGWVASIPFLTKQIVQMTLEDLDEVFDKCVLEMVDRDEMQKCYDGVIDVNEVPPGEWEPVDEVRLGVAIYVDNVGKSSGMTPVLSLL